jgi:hypothetical protein
LCYAFGHACQGLFLLGDKAGVDMLIQALDRLPSDDPRSIVFPLSDCTGQNFGPRFTTLPGAWSWDIYQWKRWWKKHRAEF